MSIAESRLLARAMMNPTVYIHPIARINKAMIRRGSERLLATTDICAGGLRRMDDHDLIVALQTIPATEAFAERYDERRLFKRAVWAELQYVPDSLPDPDHEAVHKVEATVAAGERAADGPARAGAARGLHHAVGRRQGRPAGRRGTGLGVAQRRHHRITAWAARDAGRVRVSAINDSRKAIEPYLNSTS